jgi:hypothetical protein
VCLALPHRYAGSVGKHPSGNVHRGQLLEQKLGGVGDVDLRDAVLVIAETAFEKTLLEFTGGEC